MVMKPYFHFKVIKAFMDKIYKEAILSTNLTNDGEELNFDTLWFLTQNGVLLDSGAAECTVELDKRKCVLATKGNEKYIIPLQFIEQLPFKVIGYEECYLKKADKKVWKFVKSVKRILLPPSVPNVREFVEGWNPIEHTDQRAWRFNAFVALSTLHMGIKCCIASIPSNGKGSHASIIAEITRNLLITSTPTIAKAETSLFYNQTIYFNEMGKPKAEELHAIQDFFIWLADQSVRYNKRSMAVKREMNSVDITHKSVIHTYNRKSCLKIGTLIWDEIFPNPGALRNRYPQFLLDGSVTQTIADMSPMEADKVSVEHEAEIKTMISGLMGISKAVHMQKHHYSTDTLVGFTPRQRTNIQGLIDIIDAFCLNQDEFNEWLAYMSQCKQAYNDMLVTDIQGTYTDATTGVLPETQMKVEVVKMEPTAFDKFEKIDEDIL